MRLPKEPHIMTIRLLDLFLGGTAAAKALLEYLIKADDAMCRDRFLCLASRFAASAEPVGAQSPFASCALMHMVLISLTFYLL
jgi:hypothetical protein